MLLRSLLLFAILLSAISQVLSLLCDTGRAGNGCQTNEDWRQNVICRILGAQNAAGGRDGDGYAGDALDIQQDDDFATAKSKLRASVSNCCLFLRRNTLTCLCQQKFFAKTVNVLQRFYPNYTPQQQLNYLQRVERAINNYGVILYGAGGWITDQCALVDANGQATSPLTPCGDRQNGPNCPT